MNPTLLRFLGWLGRAPAWGAIGVIRAYQRLVSPLLGPTCRFTPTCSEYFIGAVRKHGLLVGSAKGVGRIARCHPWSAGGPDPP